MEAIVDAPRCNGCGVCQIICPEVFRMEVRNGQKIAAVNVGVVPIEVRQFCLDARDCCERSAIRIEHHTSAWYF